MPDTWQGNNSYIFPAMGLAVVLWKILRIGTEEYVLCVKVCAP